MTDYRTLPQYAKKQIVFEALRFAFACIALERLGYSRLVWSQSLSNDVIRYWRQRIENEPDFVDGVITEISQLSHYRNRELGILVFHPIDPEDSWDVEEEKHLR